MSTTVHPSTGVESDAAAASALMFNMSMPVSKPPARESTAFAWLSNIQELADTWLGCKTTRKLKQALVVGQAKARGKTAAGLAIKCLGVDGVDGGVLVHTPLTEESTVSDLRKFLADHWLMAEEQAENVLLVFANFVLRDERTLQSYGVQQGSTVLVAVREAAVAKEEEEKAPADVDDDPDMKVLLEMFKPLVSKGVDCVTMDEDVKLFSTVCGHRLGKHSLLALAESQARDGFPHVQCPALNKDKEGKETVCKGMVDWPMVRQIVLSPECDDGKEMELDEALVAKLDEVEGLFAKARSKQLKHSFQNCSQCGSLLFRPNAKKGETHTFQASCRLCLVRAEAPTGRLHFWAKKNKPHTFCWACTTPWPEDTPADGGCGNSDCVSTFKAQFLHILNNCDRKTIGPVSDVPSVRACPSCGQLITHWENCKHMSCIRCKERFCFVCLKSYRKGGGGWQCGSSGDSCPIAPVQTEADLPEGKNPEPVVD